MMLLLSGFIFADSASFGAAETGQTFSGIITQDTTWTKANSPYTLTGPVAVENGATLTIEPGVTVNLASYYIRIKGTLIAKGTSEDNIYFNTNQGSNSSIMFWPGSTSWNSQTSSGSIIQNAVVNSELSFQQVSPKIDSDHIYGRISIDGSPIISNNHITGSILLSNEVNAQIVGNDIHGLIWGFHQGTVLVSNNVITGTYSDAWDGAAIGCSGFIVTNNVIKNFQYGVRLATGDITLKNNIITDNTVGIQLGHPYTSSGGFDVTIENNLLTRNSRGISITDLYSNKSVGSINVQNNNFLNNEEFNVYLGVSFSMDMPNNWWGTADLQTINQTIYDGYDDFNFGTLKIMPILTQPNPDVPQETPQPTPTASIQPTTQTYEPPASSVPTQNSQSEQSTNPQETNIEGPFRFSVIIIIAGVAVTLGLILLLVVLSYRRRTAV
jgi:hypothetical protein